MGNRAWVTGALAVGLLAVAGQGTASANAVWCVSDPPIQVVTPGGNYVEVNNMVYIPMSDLQSASLITDAATGVSDGSGGTLITVYIYIPPGVHGAYAVSSANRYAVSTSGGATGRVITLHLDVPVS